jgi:hypothetical protein
MERLMKIITAEAINRLSNRLYAAKAGKRHGEKSPYVHTRFKPYERDIIVMALRHFATMRGDVYLEE